jgi:hypothetical protein
MCKKNKYQIWLLLCDVNETYGHLFLSATVTFLLISSSHLDPAEFMHIFEAVLLGMLTFLGLQLSVAKKFAAKSEKYYEQTQAIFENSEKRLADSLRFVEGANTKLGQSLTFFEEGQKKIDMQLEIVQKGINLSAEILKTNPRFDDLFKTLEAAESVNLKNIIFRAFGAHAEAWHKQGQEISELDVSEENTYFLYLMWGSFIRQYLLVESKDLLDGRLLISSSVYTKIVVDCCNNIMNATRNKSSYDLELFLITTMLPNEFFNWPQAEYTINKTDTIYLGHTWDGSSEYFTAIKNLKEKGVKVKRCIVVSDNELVIPFVKSFSRLEEICNLYYGRQEYKYRQIMAMGIDGIFEKMTGQSKDKAKNINGIEEFGFFVIGDKQELQDVPHISAVSLLDDFITELHSDRNDARYYSISTVDEKIKNVFFNNSSVLPEFAFFRINKLSGEDDYTFALGGYLSPYTDSLRAQFIFGENLMKFQTAALVLEKQSTTIEELIRDERD